MRKTLMIAGGALVLTGAAIAQDEYGVQDGAATTDGYAAEGYQPEASAGAMSADDTFNAIDVDADGTITADEFTGYAGEGTSTQFDAMAGEDGALTMDELKSFMETSQAAE